MVSLIDLKGCFLFKRLCGLLCQTKSKRFQILLYCCFKICSKHLYCVKCYVSSPYVCLPFHQINQDNVLRAILTSEQQVLADIYLVFLPFCHLSFCRLEYPIIQSLFSLE